MQGLIIGIVGLCAGAVLGVIGAALAMAGASHPLPDSRWLSPDVVGPFLGSFLAAIVGVAGAGWVHFSSIRHRDQAATLATRIAMMRVMTASLEVYGHMRLFVDELDRGAQGLDFSPHSIEALRQVVAQLAGDLNEASKCDALRPEVASIARSGARAISNGLDRFVMDIPNLHKSPADARATLSPEQAQMAKRMVATYRSQLDGMRENMSVWNQLYQLLEPGLSLGAAVASFTSDLIPVC